MWVVWTRAGDSASLVPVLTTDDEKAALGRYEVERSIIRSGKQPGHVWLMFNTRHLAHYEDTWNMPDV